jgi:hypothetical protein
MAKGLYDGFLFDFDDPLGWEWEFGMPRSNTEFESGGDDCLILVETGDSPTFDVPFETH